ncbi:hypothetical protein Vafri_14191 [Volvox africanus]|uniref:Uncharacterized protein n=1 Tax=Volvox africanus TaxID=51714 RepID=A0A8J4BCV8_9CHLO|nr:hypothetical protein Vafri_14191 [Volvox africanus]
MWPCNAPLLLRCGDRTYDNHGSVSCSVSTTINSSSNNSSSDSGCSTGSKNSSGCSCNSGSSSGKQQLATHQPSQLGQRTVSLLGPRALTINPIIYIIYAHDSSHTVTCCISGNTICCDDSVNGLACSHLIGTTCNV